MHRLLLFAVVGLAALVVSGTAAAWSWPADGDVLRPFALGGDAYAAGQHRGVDIAGPEGSPVRAPAAGTVSFAGSLPAYGKGSRSSLRRLCRHARPSRCRRRREGRHGRRGRADRHDGLERRRGASVASVHLGVRVGVAGGGVRRPARPPPAAAAPRPASSPPAAPPTPAPRAAASRVARSCGPPAPLPVAASAQPSPRPGASGAPTTAHGAEPPAVRRPRSPPRPAGRRGRLGAGRTSRRS